MKKLLLAFLVLSAFNLPAVSFSAPAAILGTDFEKGVPGEIKTFRASVASDTTRSHSGKASLRVTKNNNAEWGSIFLELDKLMDLADGFEFSIWVYDEGGVTRPAYVSAEDYHDSRRFTAATATGAVKKGQWSEIRGKIYPGDLGRGERDVRLILRTHGTCWIDDITITPGSSTVTPAQIWPQVEAAMRAAASSRVTVIDPGDTVTLDARDAALVPDTALAQTALPGGATAVIPAEGLLSFAIDARSDLTLTGSLQLEPDADLRPGLRVTVLSDDTVIAAPSVKASSWTGTYQGSRPGPAPNIKGARPSSTVSLAPFRLGKGRHYITLAGPHIRSGGTFAKLELQAAARPAEKPLYTFGFFSDTHLGFGRPAWINIKLNVRAGAMLEAALRQLKREGAGFAIIGGDMTDGGRLSHLKELARVIKRAKLPVYGCIGNHDVAEDSRKNIAATIPKLFPSGPKNTDYDFAKPPLRFIVLDGSHWRVKDGSLRDHRTKEAGAVSYSDNMTGWLRDTLAKDTATPTIVVSHYRFYDRRGVSNVSGYNLGKEPALDNKLMAILSSAPNVVATMSGHLHFNSVSNYHGISTLQNPAFVEWPNAYRVCRVYSDRLEWEVRQIANRGLIREGVSKDNALLWMLSTSEGDLSGTVNFTRRP